MTDQEWQDVRWADIGLGDEVRGLGTVVAVRLYGATAEAPDIYRAICHKFSGGSEVSTDIFWDSTAQVRVASKEIGA